MAWVVKDEEEHKFFGELAILPDRVAGLLATTIIDDRLEDALKAHLHNVKYDQTMLFDKLFNYSAVLGSFGARIDFGFAIGLYSEEAFRDLHTIRKIRNAFAHKLAPKDFKVQSIADLCSNLRIPNKYPIVQKGDISTSGINPTMVQLMGALLAHSSVNDISDPRSRFIRSAEILSGLLLGVSIDTSDVGGPKKRRAPDF